MTDKRPPWYAWMLLAIVWAGLTGAMYLIGATAPTIGHWLRWVLLPIPTALVLPFVLKRQ